MTWLELSTCRKLGDVSPVGALGELRVLVLADLGEIDSIHPLAGLRKLEELCLLESTDVADGDLSPLPRRLPPLDRVSFMDRPRHSHTRSDSPELPADRVARWRWGARRESEERLSGATGAREGP